MPRNIDFKRPQKLNTQIFTDQIKSISDGAPTKLTQSLFSSDGDVEIINDFIAIDLFNGLVYRQLKQTVEFGPDPYPLQDFFIVPVLRSKFIIIANDMIKIKFGPS